MKNLIGRKRAFLDAQLTSLRAEFEAEKEGIRKKIEEIEEDERERLEPKTEMTVIQQTGKKGRK
ncbi:MAG: hypothetical protein HGA84_02090 [Syntrophobacteraceae bacterium]|jgi:hypothetical protein|nr:hypothetical protein [Syntrophobacteraceae bacterium]